MSALRNHLEDYLALRRSLGYKLGRPGQMLPGFVSYLEAAGAAAVTTGHALAWATEPAGADPTWWRARLTAVRGFARYLAPLVPGTEVPPRGLLPGPLSRRAVPCLYSPAEVAALMTAAGAIRAPLRAATYQALIGLLAITGLRAGEAISLDRGDLDPGQGLLTIRSGKFGKSRQLPLHASVLQALAGYAELRDRERPRPASPAFFISLAGTRLIYNNVHFTFHGLVKAAGLEPRSAACRPRVHDLRHTFAVTTLARWYADGGDVAARLPLLSTWLGHAGPSGTYWYLTGTPELLALAPALEAFFTERLARQRRASGHTVAAYRDTWRMLLAFAARRAGKPPSRLDFADLDAPAIGAFPGHLEKDRGNSIRTRNARLAAVHSAFSYPALRHPEHAALIARVLAIPAKRADKALVTWLTEDETAALLAAPDRATRTGRRDHAMLHLAVVTGLRVTGLTALTTNSIHLGDGPHVTCQGKGRKQRVTPLTATAVTALREWLRELPAGPAKTLFPGRAGGRLSRDAAERRLSLHAAEAAAKCPSLASKKISPHVLRHTAAMRLLHAGVEVSVIALWLGHEQTETAGIYLHADLALKEKALARTTPPDTAPGRYRPPDPLPAFLESL